MSNNRRTSYHTARVTSMFEESLKLCICLTQLASLSKSFAIARHHSACCFTKHGSPHKIKSETFNGSGKTWSKTMQPHERTMSSIASRPTLGNPLRIPYGWHCHPNFLLYWGGNITLQSVECRKISCVTEASQLVGCSRPGRHSVVHTFSWPEIRISVNLSVSYGPYPWCNWGR